MPIKQAPDVVGGCFLNGYYGYDDRDDDDDGSFISILVFFHVQK